MGESQVLIIPPTSPSLGTPLGSCSPLTPSCLPPSPHSGLLHSGHLLSMHPCLPDLKLQPLLTFVVSPSMPVLSPYCHWRSSFIRICLPSASLLES